MQHRSVYNSFHAFFTDLPEPVSYRQLKRKMNLMKNQETQRLYLKYQIRKEQRVVRAKVCHKFNYCSTRSFELSQTGIPRINSGHCESSFWCRANQHSNSQIQITITFHIRVRLVVQSTFSKNSRNLNAASIELTNIRTFF